MTKRTINALTLLGIALGSASIITTIMFEALALAGVFIALSAIIDRYDGILARKHGVQSRIGQILDSINDLVSFVAAPVTMLLVSRLISTPLSIIIAVFYTAAGIYRLKRFHDRGDAKDILGLPTTLSGLLLVGVIIFTPSEHTWIVRTAPFVLSALMMSTLTMRK